MQTATKAPETPVQTAQLDPTHILQIGMGYWASKTLLSAVNFQLFTFLAQKPRSAEEIRQKLGLHERSYHDFLDVLVALGFLKRTGTDGSAMYQNTPESDFFLDRNKLSYLGGILEMSNNRLYRFWSDLDEGLKTGLPQNELKQSGSKTQFDDFYSNPESLKEFLRAMSGIQMGAFIAFAKQFDFSHYSTFLDAGGGNGAFCVQVALNHPGIQCVNYDLPIVEPVAKDTIAHFNLSSRITTAAGNFFKDGLPKSDVIAMGNILHDWSENEKLFLMKQAYDALPKGGAFVVIESIIDNDRSQNAFGLLMSLNMLIETKEGFDYTFNDFDRWAHKTGFTKTDWLPLAGPTSAAIAYK
ncbi:MAG: methyltransferase [Bacteroidota bacterium]|nr:methyltransferase [Bacteroidota bacterium]